MVFGIGATLFLINFFTDQDPDVYVFSLPLVVLGTIMLYKRHFSSNLFNSSFLASLDDVDDDDLYEEAKALVLEAGKSSTSYIQRRLRIGYTRAAFIQDLLEKNGVVGPADGGKPREVIQAKD